MPLRVSARSKKKKKTVDFPFLALTFLSLHALTLPTHPYSSALIFVWISQGFFFSHLEKRKSESDIMQVRKRERKEQDIVWLGLMLSDGRCVASDASACCLSSSCVFPPCAGRKWLFYSDPCFMRHANAFSSVHCFSHNAITIFPSHGRAADCSLQGDGSRRFRMHE